MNRFLFCLSLLAFAGCATSSPVASEPPPSKPTGADIQAAAPTPLVLVSIDGLRWDFPAEFGMKSLLEMAADGATADSLVPVYPSKTFPNHYAMVTGCYADRHGLVSNEFFDPTDGSSYALNDRAAVRNAKWYGCTPLWNAVEMHGGISASYFWVGTEAAIGGRRPKHWRAYDAGVTNEARVDQALAWLNSPAAERPRLILLYLSEVDSAGHQYGPSAPETKAAAARVDSAIERLRRGIREIGRPTNLVVVSDHGMASPNPSKVVWLDEAVDLKKGWVVKVSGAQAMLYVAPGIVEPEKSKRERAMQKQLRAISAPWRVWKRDEVPKRLHFSESPRIGDLVIDIDEPWSIEFKSKRPTISKGNHGWDPTRYKNMHGVFFAEGPAFRAKARVPSFPNVDVFSLALRLLNIPSADEPSQGNDDSAVMSALAPASGASK